MSCNNYYRAKLILENNKKRWLKVNPNLPDRSGIYILTRMDEKGFRYCYIGQAKHILTRLAQHLTQYGHIDLSLKKHKLFDIYRNQYGWNVDYLECLESELDNYEKEYILKYANMGYQLRNKTAGGQSEGKAGIDENKPSKGYYDGVAYGRKQMLDEVREYFNKYLYFSPLKNEECFKKDGTLKEIYLKKWREFNDLLKGEKNEHN